MQMNHRFNHRGWGAALLLVLAVTLAACGAGRPQSGIQVKDAWVRAVQGGATGGGMMTPGAMLTPGGAAGGGMMTPSAMTTPGAAMGGGMTSELGNSAAYMILVNPGSQADRLLRVESDLANAVELHLSEMKNDVMTMHPVEAIEVPAGGQAELKPGGYHIMLIGLKRELKPGDKVTFTLVFEKAGALTVEVEVRAP